MNFPRAWLVLLCLNSVSLTAADWPQWRGPERTGHVPAGVAVPKTLPGEPKVIWRIKIGEGLASPVVAGGKVFFLDNTGGKETTHAAEAATGKLLWSMPLDEPFKDSQGPVGPRCTPLVDGGRVYAQSCRGELQCLATADGKLIWRANFVKDFGATFTGEKGQAAGASRHGNNGSPVVDGNHLIVLVGGTNGAGVVCFDKTNGKVIWKSLDDTAAYAPPIVATLAGMKQIVVFMVGSLSGLDARDGKPLWSVPFKTSFARHVTTPVVVADQVFIASHQFGLVATKILRDAGAWRASTMWTNKAAAFNFASPVAVGRHLYGVGAAKDLVCVDVTTGTLAWAKTGYFTSGADKAYAGFVVMAENLLALTDSGQLLLVAADPQECRELGRAQVCGFNWCNPAYADGKLFVRDARELLCVELRP